MITGFGTKPQSVSSETRGLKPSQSREVCWWPPACSVGERSPGPALCLLCDRSLGLKEAEVASPCRLKLRDAAMGHGFSSHLTAQLRLVVTPACQPYTWHRCSQGNGISELQAKPSPGKCVCKLAEQRPLCWSQSEP